MRTSLFFLAFAVALLNLTHSSIIIASTLPKVYQISKKQVLIVIDEPAKSLVNQPTANSDSQAINQTEVEETNKTANAPVPNRNEGYANNQNIATPNINSLFPNIPLRTGSRSVLASALLQSPSITTPSITQSSSNSPFSSISTTSIKTSSTSSSFSFSESRTIVTNFGEIPKRHKFNHIRLSSSFGSIGGRPDEDRYRTLIRQRTLSWITEQSQLTFQLAENQFSHLTIDQFRQLYLNLKVPDFVSLLDFDFKDRLKSFFNIDDNTFNSWFGKNNYKKVQPRRPVSPSKPVTPVNPTPGPVSPTPAKPAPTPSPSPTPDPTPAPAPTPTPVPVNPKPTPISPTPTPTPTPTPVTPTPPPSPANPTPAPVTPAAPTINVDWTAKGFVTPIKDQGSCGGCYAFAANAAAESAFLMKNSTQYSQINLSEQQIIDCSNSNGNKGCNGGWISNVFDYSVSNGVTTQAAYPYTQTSGSCKINGGAFKIASYTGGALTDCSALAAMVTIKPTSIAVSAGTNYWMHYAGGILNQCGTGIDHGVLLVGVFQNSTTNYWKIKNSWGTSWGEDGYIRIDRSILSGNLCDMCGYGYYPNV